MTPQCDELTSILASRHLRYTSVPYLVCLTFTLLFYNCLSLHPPFRMASETP